MIQFAAETSTSTGAGGGIGLLIIAAILIFAGSGGAAVDGEGLFERVLLSCEAEIGGKVFTAREVTDKRLWDDPTARGIAEEHLRRKLVDEVLKRWTPFIRVDYF